MGVFVSLWETTFSVHIEGGGGVGVNTSSLQLRHYSRRTAKLNPCSSCVRSLQQHFHNAGINNILILPSSFPWLTIGSVPVAAVLQWSLLMFPIMPAAVSHAHTLQVLWVAVLIISLLSDGLQRAVLPVWIGFFLQALRLWQSVRTPGWLSFYKTLHIYHLSQYRPVAQEGWSVTPLPCLWLRWSQSYCFGALLSAWLY